MDGDIINIVARVEFKGPGISICTSKLKHQSFRTDVKLTGGVVTLFNVRKQTINHQIWLVRTDKTVVLQHEAIQAERFTSVAETCAGFGGVSQGYEKCGCEVEEVNEANPRFADWLRKQGKTVVEGDIAQTETMIHLASFKSGIFSGGVSCQPWSVLGDQKELRDERSRSMTGMLMTIHLLQIPLSIMECTPKVMTSDDAQNMLQEFARLTGLVLHQRVLSLHKIWPAKRNRWWATLSHPCLQVKAFPDITPLAFDPVAVHLLPYFMKLDEHEIESLKLDDDEMEAFLSTKKGMSEHQVNPLKSVPTATHSWGSQVCPCACGCRQKGFSQKRIEEKGLYGQLLPLPEIMTIQGQQVNRMRHLHPAEVALVNGMHPFTKGLRDVSPRFALAGVGQLGSPFQSAWVLSHTLQDMSKVGLIPTTDKPIRIMQKLAEELFYARDLLLKNPPKTESTIRLEWAVQLWGNPEADAIMKDPRNFTKWAKENYPNVSIPNSLQSEEEQSREVNNIVKAEVDVQPHPEPVFIDHASQQPCANGVKPDSSIQAGLGIKAGVETR